MDTDLLIPSLLAPIYPVNQFPKGMPHAGPCVRLAALTSLRQPNARAATALFHRRSVRLPVAFGGDHYAFVPPAASSSRTDRLCASLELRTTLRLEAGRAAANVLGGESQLTSFTLSKTQGCFFNTLAAYFEAVNLAAAITKRIRQGGQPWVFTPKDFLDLGTPHAVGMTLLRLVRRGSVRRLARGLYDCPKTHPVLGQLSPPVEAIAEALAGRDGTRIQASGAYAANLLHLSEQVPAKGCLSHGWRFTKCARRAANDTFETCRPGPAPRP